MSKRVTQKELDVAFEQYIKTLRDLNMPLKGKPALFAGSKVNGRAYRLFLLDDKGSQMPCPGTGHNGYLGMTKGEAYDTLWTMVRVAQDILYQGRWSNG